MHRREAYYEEVLEKITGHYVRLRGEYDLARKDEVSALFDTLEGAGPVVIDMSDVTYIDSTILGQLASLRLRSSARPIELRGVNQRIRRIFNIVGFDSVFSLTE